MNLEKFAGIIHIVFALIISSAIMVIGHQLVQISNKNAQEKIMMYEEKIQQLDLIDQFESDK